MSANRTSVLKIAPPYDDALIRRIEQGFSNMLGDYVRFEVVEDPTLLCGFIAYVCGTVYDMSGKTQIADMREYLIDAVVVPLPAPIEEEDAYANS